MNNALTEAMASFAAKRWDWAIDTALMMAPLTEAGRLDRATLTAAFARATAGGRRAALVLANPHNPTGTVHTRDELSAVAALA